MPPLYEFDSEFDAKRLWSMFRNLGRHPGPIFEREEDGMFCFWGG